MVRDNNSLTMRYFAHMQRTKDLIVRLHRLRETLRHYISDIACDVPSIVNNKPEVHKHLKLMGRVSNFCDEVG